MLTLVLSLLVLSAPLHPIHSRPASTATVADDEYAAAQRKFLGAAKSDALEPKRVALDELVALGNAEGLGLLAGEFGRVADDLRTQREKLTRAQYELDRRVVVIDNLKSRLEVDPGLDGVLAREKERQAKLEGELAAAKRRVEALGPWRDALSEGMARLFDAVGASKRKKAELDIWKDIDEHPDSRIRAAAIDLIGRVGGPGTALLLHDFVSANRATSDKLADRLKKSMGDVREMERRLQKEAAQNAGRTAVASQQQYDQVKKEAADVQRQRTLIDLMVETAVTAGGRALSRETGKELEKSVQKLVASIKKTKDPSRLDTFALLTRATSPEVRVHVRALLAAETDAVAVAALIDGLAALGDAEVAPQLISTYLVHESWHVRSRTVDALARLRSRDGIPALIARIEAEPVGRVRTDIGIALISLTGKDFHGNVPLWQRWWSENEASFVVSPEPLVIQAADPQNATGVAFFGIETESTKVLFVLDLSGSMKFAMIPRNNPDDDPNRPYDEPREGEMSRLEVAKGDLIKAISGLENGGLYNLVLFASDVWTWTDDLVTMTADSRAQVVEFIQAADAVGATNIYGALERALDLAGAKGGDEWSKPTIDTIYLLTDGRASIGLATDTDEILAYVRERNRTAGITIHTVGLSDAHDAVLLRRLAEENHGKYVGR